MDFPAPLGPMTASRQRSPSGKLTSVQQDLAAGKPDGEVAGRHRDVPGIDELLQLSAGKAEGGAPDADDVLLTQGRGGDLLAVDVGPVVAAKVDDLVAAVHVAEFSVMPGHVKVVDDHVVVGCPANPQHGGR